MTHAERIREAERKVRDEARKAWIGSRPIAWTLEQHLAYPDVNASMRDCRAMFVAVGELERLESQTCPKCGGTGGWWQKFNGTMGEDKILEISNSEYATCHAGCDNGRKREE